MGMEWGQSRIFGAIKVPVQRRLNHSLRVLVLIERLLIWSAIETTVLQEHSDLRSCSRWLKDFGMMNIRYFTLKANLVGCVWWTLVDWFIFNIVCRLRLPMVAMPSGWIKKWLRFQAKGHFRTLKRTKIRVKRVSIFWPIAFWYAPNRIRSSAHTKQGPAFPLADPCAIWFPSAAFSPSSMKKGNDRPSAA